MIDFDKYRLRVNRVGKKVYAIWNNSIYLQIADLLKDPEPLTTLDRLVNTNSIVLSQIRKDFSNELNKLSDEEFDALEDNIEIIDDLISKLEYKIMAVEWIIIHFNKLLEQISDSKYSEEIDDFIQEIPESLQYIKINRLILS